MTARGVPPRVVIVGAGFAGLAVAQGLPRAWDVTVLDPGEAFDFLPNIHELVSGLKRRSDLQLPRRRLVERAGHRFVAQRASAIHLDRRVLCTGSGVELNWDRLVVATGGANSFYGVPGADRHALPFKSVADCAAIGARLRGLVTRGGVWSVVIVGGGIEGVEALGEVLRAYRGSSGLRVHLVDAGARLMSGAPASIHERVAAHARAHGVELHLGRRVAEVHAAAVALDNGACLNSDATIWTGGARPPELLSVAGLAAPDRWAPVGPTLQSEAHPHVFVAGDAAAFPGLQGKQAYHAMEMGARIADNLRGQAAGRPLRPLRPSRKPMLVAFGDLDAFLVAGDTVAAGPSLGLGKEAVCQLVMAQLDRPTRASSVRGLSQRLRRAATHAVWPGLSSWEALRRTADIQRLV